jgi:4-amino-4-deoxy-L-arabinose transferase-like glycosyltransferase
MGAGIWRRLEARAPFAVNAGAREWAWVVVLCGAQVLLWSLAFGLTYKAPEIDSAEQFVWSFSLESGYWKHPPMPSWIMHALISVFGTSVVLPFIATQTSVVIALALTWRLGCEFMSAQRSLVAMVLTSLVTYHNIGADSFNHSTALLPFQAAVLLVFYRATREGIWHQWALAGLFAGLAMLVKYVALWPLLGMLVYFALDRHLHTRRQFAGLAIALTVFALTMLPHVIWLHATDFLPFRYARSVAQSLPGLTPTVWGLGVFLLMQVLRMIPFVCGAWFVLRPRAEAMGQSATADPDTDRRDRMFLWVAASSPLLFTIATSLLSQTEMQSRWGTNAFLLSGWVLMASVRRIDNAQTLNRALRFAGFAHLTLCLSMTLAKTVLAEQLKVRTRANFPGAVLAKNAHLTWKQHSDVPLRIVVSDIWLGGNIVANSTSRVAVLIDGHHIKSPWVREKAVNDCGALILDDLTVDAAGRGQANAALDALMARARYTGTWELPWAGGTEGRTELSGRVRWGIILPGDAAHCAIR